MLPFDVKSSSIIATTSLSRRSLITGLTALIAAPAIVRASSLMDLRGVPIGKLVEFFPCDGRVMSEMECPSLFKAFGRRYGGSDEEKTFAVPDFSGQRDFGLGLSGNVELEVDRGGELFMSVAAAPSLIEQARDRLRGGTFTAEQVEALVRGERLKL